jgi:hypothetical protein
MVGSINDPEDGKAYVYQWAIRLYIYIYVYANCDFG